MSESSTKPARKPKVVLTEPKDIEFEHFKVRLTLTEPLLGTVPKDPDIYSRFIAKKAPTVVQAEAEVDTVPVPEEPEEAGWTSFHTDERGWFLYDYALLGFLKEASNALKGQLGVSTALRSKIDMYVFVRPRRLRLYPASTGHLDRPLRAMTRQGPRVTVVRSDYVGPGTIIEAYISVVGNSDGVNGPLIESVLRYGIFRGLGQFRNGSYGRFTYEMERIEEKDLPVA